MISRCSSDAWLGRSVPPVAVKVSVCLKALVVSSGDELDVTAEDNLVVVAVAAGSSEAELSSIAAYSVVGSSVVSTALCPPPLFGAFSYVTVGSEEENTSVITPTVSLFSRSGVFRALKWE